MLAGAILYIPLPDYAISPNVSKGMGQGEGFTWPGDISVSLPEEFDPNAVFPLQALDANLVCRYPGPPDKPVCGLHQSDGKSTIDISTYTGVGLPPLCCEADGYCFQSS